MPRYKHTGALPNSMIGSIVRFSAPGDVKARGGGFVEGIVVDEVWEIESSGAPEARHLPAKHHWGEYCFFSQFIRWSNGHHSIRIGYYRRRHGEPNWTFGSQTTVSADPPTIARLLRNTLAKKDWYQAQPRAS